MKLGIGSYTYPWAIGLPGAQPSEPLKPIDLMEKARELGVGIVQFGPNMPLDKLPEKELREVVKRADSWKIDLELGMVGFDLDRLRFHIQFARRIGAILLKTTPERPDEPFRRAWKLPMLCAELWMSWLRRKSVWRSITAVCPPRN